jgi:hypothetical protein
MASYRKKSISFQVAIFCQMLDSTMISAALRQITLKKGILIYSQFSGWRMPEGTDGLTSLIIISDVTFHSRQKLAAPISHTLHRICIRNILDNEKQYCVTVNWQHWM